MQTTEARHDVGVIVGRFQVAGLHDGHKELLQYVCDRHRKVIVLLGIAPLPSSTSNPLDFEARRQMIQEEFPNIIVLYVRDISSDVAWSRDVDSAIKTVVGPNQTVVLYGSRDSFITYYSGVFPTQELNASYVVSGTEHRAEVRQEVVASTDFRKGVIWGSAQRFPTAFTAVDVAIFSEDFRQLVLGMKPYQSQWQLPGGFSDPIMSDSFEEDAAREAHEETGIVVRDIVYLLSRRIDDWRYKNEPDCIKTLLFAAVATNPDELIAADDIIAAKWFDVEELIDTDFEVVRSNHFELVKNACEYAQSYWPGQKRGK